MKLPYERFVAAPPRLVWAVERSWSRDEAAAHSGRYDSLENTTWFVESGRATVDGQVVEAGEWLFLGPGMKIRQFQGPLRFLSIGLHWRWPDAGHLYEAGLPRIVKAEGLAGLRECMTALLHSVRGIAGEDAQWLGGLGTDLAALARLQELGAVWAARYAGAMEWLGIVPNLGATADPRLEPARLLIASWSFDRPLRMEEIAAASGLSARQFHRLFQQLTGSTPRETFEARRYEHVRRQLLQPAMRIKEVAASVGFADLAAFNRWFQRRSGCSPRAFRQLFFG